MIFQLIKFCAVGFSGLFIDFGLTYLFKNVLKVNKYVANTIGFCCAASSNYILNRVWTFQSSDPEIAKQYLLFIAVSIVGLLINNGVIYILNDKMRWGFYISKFCAIGVVTFWNFFMNYFFTF